VRASLWPIFVLLLVSSPARISAQGTNSETRVLATIEGGTASGLGYKLPHILAGIAMEQPLGTRWEAQGGVSWSPDRKYITNDGNSVQAGGTALFWPIHRVGITGGLQYTHLWTSQFNKSGYFPAVGAVLRDNWYGNPGRFYASYVFPTGCQWGASCVIQSSRTSGLQMYQEFRLWSHWRVGIRGAWWHFAEQSNQLDPAAGRVWHNTGTMAMTVRYEFRAGSVDTEY
jgi:hypothetical protein